MDEPKPQVIIAHPEDGNRVEAAATLILIENGLSAGRVKIITHPSIPKNTIYILPKGIPDIEDLLPFDSDWEFNVPEFDWEADARALRFRAELTQRPRGLNDPLC